MPLHLEIVTAERHVLSDDVDQINAPTLDGRIGILPKHMPLITVLSEGELSIIKGGVRTEFAVFGGFMEVLPDRVTIFPIRAIAPMKSTSNVPKMHVAVPRSALHNANPTRIWHLLRQICVAH